MIQPSIGVEDSGMYLTIGPFLLHHTWKKDSLGSEFEYILKHYAGFITPADNIDPTYVIHEIPLYPRNAPPGAMNAANWMTIENELRHWAARQARQNGGFMCHAAGLIHRGRGWLLPGRSGAGKSTLALKLAPKCDLVLSDEVCIALPVAGTWKLWGTPFYGTGEQGVTGSGCVLEAILFPHRDRAISIAPIDKNEALAIMLRAIVSPDKLGDKNVLDDAIALVESHNTFRANFAYRSTTEEVYDAVIAALSS